jgi:ABC-2 type transport system ATP-binding protein
MQSLTFSYTTQRKAFLNVAAIWASVLLLEGSLIALLIVVFVDTLWLRAALVVLVVGLLLGLIGGLLLAPLWTKHRLTATHLHLRYGWDRIDVPRAAITKAEPVHERLNSAQLLRALHEPRKERVVMALSEDGQISIHLDQAHRWRVNGQTHAVKRILFNADQPNELLAALNMPQSPPEQVIRTPPIGRAVPLDLLLHPAPVAPHPAVAALCTEGLTRRYGEFVALDDLRLRIAPGEVYGFLGPNGAGKTTMIRMLVGLLEPSAGRAFIAGHDVWAEPVAAKRALGYVPDRAVLYERLTGREFLHFLAQMRGIPLVEAHRRIDDLIDLLELRAHAERLCGAYSFGMQRKLSLAGALLHRPQVLILDEPLNGLDPLSARRLHDVFAELAAQGTTILLSTHDLATAETVCHRVGVLQAGRLVAQGRPHDLRDLLAAPDLETVFFRLTMEHAVKPL